ncbi:hypothetical protein [uncultured Psychrobacter sp.]|uniref:hypothetical protein n=1 Tax=uncultured Psychrobacter sp. TaxID=259303 RepID=UPI0030DBAABF
MTGILAKQWVSQDALNQADELGLEIWVRKMDVAANPLKEHDITYVACTRQPRATNDAHYCQDTSYELKDLEKLIKEHAKAEDLDFKDMLYFPVFISTDGTIGYSTNQTDGKVFSGYVYFSKKMIREWLCVKTISAASKKIAKVAAETALIKLSKWTYGDVYSVSIEKDDEVIDMITDIYALPLISKLTDDLMDNISARMVI